ncbi:MAG: hypothetical protein IKY52_02580 [Clostridia bacterium]|nr:hypothetical protein [Clostridia bacterium]
MIFNLKATAYSPESGRPAFPASIPGSVQADFLAAYPDFCPDWQFADNYKKLIPMEAWSWVYTIDTRDVKTEPGERLFFVTEGIDYEWELYVGKVRLHKHEGMFSRTEVELTGMVNGDTELTVHILPHPMRHHDVLDRTQADHVAKPPVSYGWDWHPRVIPSGIWDDTWLETRSAGFITHAEPRYELADDYSSVKFRVEYERYLYDNEIKLEDEPRTLNLTEEDRLRPAYTGNEACQLTILDPDGVVCYFGPAVEVTIDNPRLWWCSGQGEQALYTWVLTSENHTRTGKIGFRTVELVMNDKAWEKPYGFPKSRSNPPATIRLNGRKIFAKGSNYVNHQVWTGTVDAEEYLMQIRLAKECNMNIFRCWGGSGVQKQAFYDLCDREGIMIWLEFPLACNNYNAGEHYLSILEQEGRAIVKKFRFHPCITLWCGGNELFNSWSGMTDQSLALRLLNKITYELAPEIPFIMTSPLDGMKHGGYTFLDRATGLDPFALFGACDGTTYTEFGSPGTADVETLKKIIPAEELYPPKAGGAWEEHHGFNAWGADAWLCPDTLYRFGEVTDIESLVETSAWLQGMGYKGIFEAARRQWPQCSMAINWCWCEPWICAVNNSLIGYNGVVKPAYYDVQASLREVTPALGVMKFMYAPGEEFAPELWLFNDTDKSVSARITAWADFGDGVKRWFATDEIHAGARVNKGGAKTGITVPVDLGKGRFTAVVQAEIDGEVVENRYVFAVEA